MLDTLHTETPAPTPDTAEVVLAARGVTKSLGAIRALKGVNFDVHRGQVTTLFGENGAGKSTLMKILSGVHLPTTGTLILTASRSRSAPPSSRGSWASRSSIRSCRSPPT